MDVRCSSTAALQIPGSSASARRCPPSWLSFGCQRLHPRFRVRLRRSMALRAGPVPERSVSIRKRPARSAAASNWSGRLVPEKKQLRFSVAYSQAHINQIEEEPKQRVRESEEHRRSKSYRSGAPTRSSLPADE